MTLARYALDDLLTPTTVAERLARLRAEGLADATGLAFVLDRVEELVHEEPKAADELAALVEAATAHHPQLRARSRYLRARVLAERGELDAALSSSSRPARAGGRRASGSPRCAPTSGGCRCSTAEGRGDAREEAVARHLAAAAEVLEEVGSPHLWYRYRLRRARLHRRQGRVEAAEELLRRAVDDVERLGGALPGLTLRAAFRAENVAAHDELVELLVGRGSAADVADAERVSRPAKARTLPVGALAADDAELAAFSSRGGWVKVAAPGEGIVGPMPGGGFARGAARRWRRRSSPGRRRWCAANPRRSSAAVSATITSTAERLARGGVAYGAVDPVASLRPIRR